MRHLGATLSSGGSGMGLALGIVSALACAGDLPKGRSAAAVRNLVPVPICSAPLAAGAAATAGADGQPPDERYWTLLWPEGDVGQAGAIDCAGAPWPAEAAGTGQPRSPIVWSQPRAPLGAAWLPLETGAGASEGAVRGGALALLGVRDGRIEVYGLGSHRGVPEASQVSIGRVGPDLWVVVGEKSCDAQGAGCEAWAALSRLERGRLAPRGRLMTERVRRVQRGHRSLEYRFDAGLDFQPDGVHVSERLSVRDTARGDAEITELARVLRFDDGAFVESSPSLLGELERLLAAHD